MRLLPSLAAAVLPIALAIAGYGYRSAVAVPVVRRAAVSLPGWPAAAPPVTVALVSDIHVGNLVTDGPRVERIAAQVNALRPDLVVLAGDFIGGHDKADGVHAAALVAGLRALRAPLGVVAVAGNHDHWTDMRRLRRALAAAGVTLIGNDAVRRGPLAIGGLDDIVTGHGHLRRTRRAMRAVGGVPLLVSHSPDIAPFVGRGLILAGHTHCGQIVLPWYGPLAGVSHYGRRYECGVIREGPRTVIVSAGVGTSVLPLRLGVPPDLWLVRLGP